MCPAEYPLRSDYLSALFIYLATPNPSALTSLGARHSLAMEWTTTPSLPLDISVLYTCRVCFRGIRVLCMGSHEASVDELRSFGLSAASDDDAQLATE